MKPQNANLYAEYACRFPTGPGTKQLIETPDGVRCGYTEAETESARLARFLSDGGVRPGDRISVQVHKSPAAVWLYLACIRGGFVFHPLNPAYTPSEVDYILSDAEPSVFVVAPELLPVAEPLQAKLGIRHLFTLDADGGGTLLEASRDAQADHVVALNESNDVAALLYSSGTTGRPKGIMLTHGNLVANGRALVRTWGFTSDDVLLHVLPIFHVHGLFVALGCVLMSGAGMQFIRKFDVGQVIDALSRSTVMMGVPTYYERLLASPTFDREHCRNIRLFTSGSAPLRTETFHAFSQRSGHVILERYGMTEAGIITSNPLHGERKPGAVGPPLETVEMRVVDGQGVTLSRDQIGNVQISGASVFPGYWRRPDKTRDDFTADGFFETGDQGFIDDDGYLTIVGRSKDMIISGGLNVYPKEVERVIDELPEVNEAAVIGVPDPDLGEAVVAVLMLNEDETITAEEVRERLRGVIAGYKVPKRVIMIDELPRNTLGKVQKNVLRERYAGVMDQS
jgi:malonyl-CoA/methylmalonyl-CoA synthetase